MSLMDTYQQRVGQLLRKSRQASGLSVQDAVDRMAATSHPVDIQTWYAWERGFRRPTIDALPAIRATLRLQSFDEILPRRVPT